MAKIIVIISGIGTGGHYFPAVVVAKEFLKQNFETIFLVRNGYPEEDIAKKFNLKTFAISPRPYYGKTILNKIFALYKVVESVQRLNKITQHCIGLSFGGFGSLPLIISCILNRQAFYLFEPNRIPGRTTRLFAPYARKVFLGLPCAVRMKGNLMVTGIPIRDEFKGSFNLNNFKHRKTVLVMGGSQGAKKLNELAIRLQRILPEDYNLIIISGKRDFEWVNREKDKRTYVISFTTEPWNVIAQADVIISRAGALSGYELLAMRKSVLFIPFPFAVDNHQYYNAQYFCQLPNVRMELEENLNEKELLKIIMELINAPGVESYPEMINPAAEKIIVETVLGEMG